MERYKSIRNILEKKRDELISRMTRIEKQPGHMQRPLSKDFEEQAVEVARKGVIDALDEASRAELEKINQALVRMDENVFGICSVCGNDLDIKRLEALPYTDLCVSCAKKEGN